MGKRHSRCGVAQGHDLSCVPIPVGRCVGVLISLLLVTFCLTATNAAAESLCTDTWTGPGEGNWLTATDWSAEHVPTSADVACIGAGKTVNITEGTNSAGVVQGEGGLAISGGSFELTNSLEASSIHSLVMKGGELAGVGTIKVSGSLTWGHGIMSGPGSTILTSGATGTKEESGANNLIQRTFVNEGTFTSSEGAFSMHEGAEIKNSGILNANGTGTVFFAEGSGAPPLIVNTGTFQKTAGSGLVQVGVDFENRGTVNGKSAPIGFSGTNVTLATGSVLEGAIAFEGSETTVTAESFSAPGATATLSTGTLKMASGSLATLGHLVLWGGTLSGPGTLKLSGSLTWKSGTMSGAGTTILMSSASASKEEKVTVSLDERTFINEGSFTLSGNAIEMGEGARFENAGTFTINEGGSVLLSEEKGSEPLFVNTGTVDDPKGFEVRVELPFENQGIVTGNLAFRHARYPEPPTEWGGEENPRQPSPCEGAESVNCATGNFSESETDFAISGRGVGLSLARTYNSQAAATGVHGIFGYGWSSSFSDHLIAEPSSKRATLAEADGANIAFAEGSGGTFTAPAWTQDTLSGTPSAGYTLTLENQTVYRFAGSSGRLESVTDRNGNATTLAYNASGALETITDPAGRTIKLAYNGEGLVESATDPMKHVVKYTYEGGNLATVTQPAEVALRWQLKYDGSHRLTEVTDGRGGKATNEYNSANEVVSQTDPMKRVTTFEYTPFRTLTKNHSTGAETVEYIASSGLPVAITRGYGTSSATTESKTYDSAGDLLSLTDGDGHTTKYGYDGHGNRTKMVDPDGDESTWTYDSTHDVETETKPNKETTTYKRDSHGNPEIVERPAPGATTQITKYAYDSHGSQTSMEDPLKRTWKYEYDAAGDRTAEIDPEGDKRTWGYDEDSQETSMVSPRGHVTGAKESKFTTTTERDAQGRPIKVTDPLKHETKNQYDGNGNLETKTDAEGHVTTYTYDADNERTKVKEPNEGITETGYDGAGQVTSQTDGNKHTTTYVRNVLEQVIEVIDPLKRATLNEYDKAGNLTTVLDAAKRTTTYKYDPANHVVEVSYSDGKTPTVKYEYNADGDRTKMIDGTGTTSYEYDQLDRLTEGKDGHGDSTGYEYDLANEQTKITYPNGKAVIRAYDNAGRLRSVTDWLEDTTKFSYDADSELTAIAFPTGTGNEDTYAYDEADAMKEVKMARGSETLASLIYTRNKAGEVLKATTKGLPGEEIPAFGYDSNSRIVKGAGIVYKYDAGNDPTTIGSDVYKYNAADELETSKLKTTTIATYSYDEVGERTKTTPASGPATTYEYNQADRLTAVTRPKEGTTPAIEDTYAYNGDGLRTAQTISGSTTYVTWDLAEKLPLILNDGSNSYVYGPGGLVVEQISGEGSALYAHHDQQGSTRMLTNATGENVGSVTYDAYGNVLGRTGAATSALGYDGQYTDSDTGLIDLRARYYDPATAQFMTIDPKVEETQEVYAYAANSPLSLGDPGGMSPQGCHSVNSPCGRLEKLLDHHHRNSSELERAFATILRYFNLPQPARGVGYELEPVRNRNGITIREPGTTGPASTIRIMFGDRANPNGSAVINNEYGQPVDYRTGGTPATRADWHIPGGNKEPVQGLPAWWRGE